MSGSAVPRNTWGYFVVADGVWWRKIRTRWIQINSLFPVQLSLWILVMEFFSLGFISLKLIFISWAMNQRKPLGWSNQLRRSYSSVSV